MYVCSKQSLRLFKIKWWYCNILQRGCSLWPTELQTQVERAVKRSLIQPTVKAGLSQASQDCLHLGLENLKRLHSLSGQPISRIFFFFLIPSLTVSSFALSVLPLVPYHTLLWSSQLPFLNNMPVGSDKWLLRLPQSTFYAGWISPSPPASPYRARAPAPHQVGGRWLALLSGPSGLAHAPCAVSPAFQALFLRAAPHSISSQPVSLPGALPVQMDKLPFVLI